MNLRRDEYTGETYDADRWYRGAGGIWHDKIAERKHEEAVARRMEARRSLRNANRVARGKRPKTEKEFQRSAIRYQEYLNQECYHTFEEYLKYHKER